MNFFKFIHSKICQVRCACAGRECRMKGAKHTTIPTPWSDIHNSVIAVSYWSNWMVEILNHPAIELATRSRRILTCHTHNCRNNIITSGKSGKSAMFFILLRKYVVIVWGRRSGFGGGNEGFPRRDINREEIFKDHTHISHAGKHPALFTLFLHQSGRLLENHSCNLVVQKWDIFRYLNVHWMTRCPHFTS